MEKRNSSTPIFQCSSNPLSGFTLIEILLVVVIILIATGVAIPKFRGTFQGTQMQDAARATIRMARYARSMSILQQKDYTLKIDDHLLTVSSSGGGSNSNQTVTRRIPDDIEISEFENKADSDHSEKENRSVLFSSSGMNDGFDLTLSDKNNRRVDISCDPFTGKIKVEEK